MSPLRDGVDVFSCKQRPWNNKIRKLVYCYVYLSNGNYVLMAVRCKGLYGNKLPWNLEGGSG